MIPFNSNHYWTTWQKILFRFFVVFLFLLSQLAYNPFLNLLGYGYRQQMQLNGHLTKIVSWLDDHIFHIGFLPRQHAIDFSDTHFGVVLLLSIFILASFVCIVWTLTDKTRTGYHRFYYWFRVYLAYYIFLAMSPYAIEKIIPIQAHYPTAPELLTRWGDLHNWEVLFRFMGTSPAYCMFCGWLEFIASILLLFYRTRVLGGILMIIALVQVVLLNIFYNNNIILLSGILLLSSIFIIASSILKLFMVFIRLKPVSLAERRYKFITPWKKYVAVAICFLPVWKFYKVTTKSWTYYKGTVCNQQKQSLYNVDVYQNGIDTVAPLTTNKARWKYLCFLNFGLKNQQMIKFDMEEKQSTYLCKWDTVQKKIFFPDKDTAALAYTILSNKRMQLQGDWHGEHLSIMITKLSLDSLKLIKDKFLFMQEDQSW